MADYGRIALSYMDYGDETATFSIDTDESDGAGLDAMDALLDTLKTTAEALMISPSLMTDTRMYRINAAAEGPSASQLAQRECKLLVIGRDSVTGKPKRAELPCFDLTELSAVSKDTVDITAGAGLAFLNALEAVWVNTATGNAVEVLEMRHVGRNT